MNPSMHKVYSGSMSLADYARFCCTGRLPPQVEQLKKKSEVHKAFIEVLELIGKLEPDCVFEPSGCDPEIRVTRSVEVAAATLNADGTITPSEERLISVCAPMNKALMVKELEVLPENDTAEEQPVTQPIYKRVNIAGFGEWCLPFEPLNQAGLFVSVQNILVPPEAGFSVYVQNYDTVSPALYKLRSRLWACC